MCSGGFLMKPIARFIFPVLIPLALLGATPAPLATVPAIKGHPGAPTPLFNGKDLNGWTWHPSVETLKLADIWTVKDGILHCAVARTTGYIDTEQEYKNFILTVEYR